MKLSVNITQLEFSVTQSDETNCGKTMKVLLKVHSTFDINPKKLGNTVNPTRSNINYLLFSGPIPTMNCFT